MCIPVLLGDSPWTLSPSPQELARRPVPDWLGEGSSLAEPQSQEGGKRVARGWDASSGPGRLGTLRQERACHQAHK